MTSLVVRGACIALFSLLVFLSMNFMKVLYMSTVETTPASHFRTENANVFEEWMMSYLADPKFSSVSNMGRRFRLFKSLYLSSQKRSLDPFEQRAYNLLEINLFDWLNKNTTVDTFMESFTTQRGIVILIGKNFFHMGVHLIRCIRMLGSDLPVHVYYGGPNDLLPEQMTFLSTMSGVTVVDIHPLINNSLLKLGGWDIKPFAMLVCPFKEVLLLDADTVLMQKPDLFFEYEEYRQIGTLFFYDRFFDGTPGKHSQWLETVVPVPHSQKLRNSHIFKGLTQYEQESGVVLIDKTRRLFGLLAVCRLNNQEERDVIHSMTYGDKETFWLGFEIAEEPYEFLEPMSGTIHSSEIFNPGEQRVICGHLAHFDGHGNLLWFNDGIVMDKRGGLWEAENFKIVSSKGKWGYCLDTKDAHPIPPHQMRLLEKIKDLWEIDPLKGRQIK